MANPRGYEDKNCGLEQIRKNIAEMADLRVKVGIVEGAGDTDGVPIAKYAAWNEFGVRGKKGWKIPPRSFIRGWAENKESSIRNTADKLFKLVSAGKLDAETAMGQLGEFGKDGIKSYIMTGDFKPNSDITIHGSKPGKNGKQFIKPKKSSKPLIDTGAMKNAVEFKVISKNTAVEGPVLG